MSVLFEIAEGVALITLNRPRVLNALSTALKRELASAFERIASDSSIRAVVLMGAGKAFSAGQDLNEAKDLDGAGAEEWVRDYARLYEKMRAVNVPIVAAVSGWAVGAGLQLALLSDIRLCSPTAKFAMPEIKDGIPAIFGLALLSTVVGMSRSLTMVLTGDPLSPKEALQAGMVSRIVPQARLLKEAKRVAKKLASYAPLAMKLDKQFARQLDEKLFQDAVEFAIAAHHQSFESGDARKGMEAFLSR